MPTECLAEDHINQKLRNLKNSFVSRISALRWCKSITSVAYAKSAWHHLKLPIMGLQLNQESAAFARRRQREHNLSGPPHGPPWSSAASLPYWQVDFEVLSSIGQRVSGPRKNPTDRACGAATSTAQNILFLEDPSKIQARAGSFNQNV